MITLRLREVEKVTQDLTASKRQSQDLTQGLPDSEILLLSLYCVLCLVCAHQILIRYICIHHHQLFIPTQVPAAP